MLTKRNGEKKKSLLSFQRFLLAILILPIFLTGITSGGLDETPPIITMVIDDGDSTYDTTQLRASWSAHDESPVTEY